MEIEVNGKIIQLPVTSLGDQMDAYLKILFTRYFSNPLEPYNEFKKEIYQDLLANIHSYLDGKINEPPGHDYLFNNLTVISNQYLVQGRVGEAQQFWQDILDIVLSWEYSRQKRIHKGSPFYFWSQIAIFQGQLDKGFFLIHSAYEEDKKTFKSDNPYTPAFKTVSLVYDDPNNLLYGHVKAWAEYLDGFLDKYRKSTGYKLTLDDFQRKFLNTPPSRDTLFSFTYALAKLYDFDRIPNIVVKGNFASIFELDILFDLILSIDEIICSSVLNTGGKNCHFNNLALHLLIQSRISLDPKLTYSHLAEINIAQNNDFEKTLNDLLGRGFVYSDGISPSLIESNIGIAYCIRNRSAHNIDSFPIIRNEFLKIRQSIFNVLFLAVEFL